ncbi:glucose-1-phosphate adenylyltransferase [Bacillus sp. HMF5848]|uniref:glucose-1-phosphate adenylyltransferase n=1 Tax=Bacillus sp. HMF5848 TaxID=2495421 RepID=UPI000F76C730|nr:glucose-1-phosphate adenylyltransferase [Bacillus sp. HMF5848]RSK26606.1 glucose-1-phosphate adenylyltransferase [Bacillus sp. HMF5848]
MSENQYIAVVLAGGKGTRLKDLTKHTPKPTVPFGGKFRIIDFTLSNCRNSGITTVDVLAQHYSHVLYNYIGDGSHWGFTQNESKVRVLSPEQSHEGTSHAVYQYLRHIDQQNPEHVLILSGDQIYKMDYTYMLRKHIQTDADATISVINVPWHEAKRFGIMSIDTTSNRILDFEEKPQNPKSNLASMGIYCFKWSVLKKYVELVEGIPDSTRDFGRDVIPTMIQDNCQLHAYVFKGYWKDVGTIESYWEANLDLLTYETNPLIHKEYWPIYTEHKALPPMYVNDEANVKKSIISEGCKIFGTVVNSVISHDVIIHKNAVVKDSVILPHTIIGEHATVSRTVVGKNTCIKSFSEVGSTLPYSELTLIGDNETVYATSPIITSHIIDNAYNEKWIKNINSK